LLAIGLDEPAAQRIRALGRRELRHSQDRSDAGAIRPRHRSRPVRRSRRRVDEFLATAAAPDCLPTRMHIAPAKATRHVRSAPRQTQTHRCVVSLGVQLHSQTVPAPIDWRAGWLPDAGSDATSPSRSKANTAATFTRCWVSPIAVARPSLTGILAGVRRGARTPGRMPRLRRGP
jgi:hypothetical protein